MNLTTTHKMQHFSEWFFSSLRKRSQTYTIAVIVSALIAFEFFSFSSTDFALQDILGDQGIGFVRWSTILALAFCGLDFAGITRLLAINPKNQHSETGGWLLLAAWVLAAAMNTALTWWGISVVIYNQPVENALIMDPMFYVTVIPVVVAVVIWCIRILIIGTLVTSLKPQPERTQKAPDGKRVASLGFKSSDSGIPPGYKPMPNHARAQR